ncbi:GHMP kinase [Azospirillum brasilense]|uniref:GHMP family kinase ATP-binding protein n=1 Tax=Azospirillum brasilense TaxID=192 RepID=UPI00190DD1B3|nr:kinase [Azospirillum brasilense]MBK3733618.1 GHMP kinase [Azospirillum brasilense]
MIISKTPLRMSFMGGGSDLPSFYRQHGGLVISTAIDKYVFVNVNPKFDDGVRVSYSVTETVGSAKEVAHPLVRASCAQLGIAGGLEITSIADIPASGTGLGSSSSFTVGLLHALSAYQGAYMAADDLARGACHIEIDVCGEPIGKQDQYAAAFGGLNAIEFHPNDTVTVTPVVCDPAAQQRFEESILVFYTGRTRSASNILKQQSEKSASNTATIASLQTMVSLAQDFLNYLRAGNTDILGEILHEGWVLKRGLSQGITDEAIDGFYERARAEGATGGKLLGAGGGGFLMIYAPPERHEAITRALGDLRRIDMPFAREGSKIIFYQPPVRKAAAPKRAERVLELT